MNVDDLIRGGRHLVVVVAHPDDESFGCGSLIAAATAGGARATVICATRGEAGERVPDPETDAVPLGTVRERELRAAGEVLGVDAIELLDLADSGFDGPLPEGALCALAVDDLADDIESRLDRLGADVVMILDGTDGHRDHQHVRAAVEVALARSGRPRTLVQTGLPNSLMRRWVEEARRFKPDAAYLDLDIDALGRPDSELVGVDVSAYLPVRELALACHRSQSSPFDELSPALRGAFLDTTYVTVELIPARAR